MTITEESTEPHCAYESRLGRCEEPVVGYFIIESADLVPEVAAGHDLATPMPFCDRHARMYRGRKVPPPAG